MTPLLAVGIANQALGPWTKLALDIGKRVVPAVAAGGAAGYGAHRLTDHVADLRPETLEPRPDHAEAIADVLAPVPAAAAGLVLLGAGIKRAHTIRRVTEVVEHGITGEALPLVRRVPRGWTTVPGMMRGAGLGAVIGATAAAGLLVPIVGGVAGVFGSGAAAATRAATPDWMRGPMDGLGTATDAASGAVGAVVDAGARILDGPPPETRRIHAEIPIEPGTFDPATSLGLDDIEVDATVDHPGKAPSEVHDAIVDSIEERTGVRVQVTGEQAGRR